MPMRVDISLSFLLFAIMITSPTSYALEGWSGKAVDQAIADADILPADSLETKIVKSVCLVDTRATNYLRHPQHETSSNYNLDGERSAEEILEERRGGYCGSRAKSIAAMLVASGIPQDNVRLVEGTLNTDFRQICAKKHEKVKHPLSDSAATCSCS